MWLSYRDCAHLFERCLQADYDYEIVYGISDNDRKYYSLDRAKEVLGYDPQDNSAAFIEGESKEVGEADENGAEETSEEETGQNPDETVPESKTSD